MFIKLEARGRLSGEERRGLEEAFRTPRPLAAGQEVVAQGQSPTFSTAFLEGYGARVTTLSDGRQQISEINIPGDFADLHSYVLSHMDHSVVALTDCVIVNMGHREIRRLTERFPHLARMLWSSTLIDAAIHRQWLVGLGRRGVVGQLAHLVCELKVRLAIVGLVENQSFELPLHQGLLADALGRSRSSVNQALQILQGEKLLRWSRERIEVLDWPGLVELADFDGRYLQVVATPA